MELFSSIAGGDFLPAASRKLAVICLYLSGLAIGSSIALSPSDIKGALVGFVAVVVLILILNLATIWAGKFLSDFVVGLAGYYVGFYTLTFLIFLINLAAALLILLPLSLARLSRSRA